MAKDPGLGYKVTATITKVAGPCAAGHQVGESFEICCHNPAGLCGYFYHKLFPDLQTFQFGGSAPWWQGDTIEVICPDPVYPVTLRLEREKREEPKVTV